MNIRIFILSILMSFGNICLGQNVSDTTLLSKEELDKAKVFYDLSEALKTPLEVYVLDLRGKGLDSLPESIGQLLNLQSLKLSHKTREDCPKKIIRKSKKIGGGLMHLDRLSGKYIAYNHITFLPESIAELDKLQEINLGYNNLTEVPMVLGKLKNLKFVNLVGCYGLLKKENELKELKSTLPDGCVFWTDLRI